MYAKEFSQDTLKKAVSHKVTGETRHIGDGKKFPGKKAGGPPRHGKNSLGGEIYQDVFRQVIKAVFCHGILKKLLQISTVLRNIAGKNNFGEIKAVYKEGQIPGQFSVNGFQPAGILRQRKQLFGGEAELGKLGRLHYE